MLKKFNSIPKLIGTLLFVLAVLLPIQNLLVVFLVNVLGLPNWLALWKEFLILVLVVLMIADLKTNIGLIKLKYKWFLGLFGLLQLLVFTSSFIFNKVPFNQFILGYRFELFWLWLWIIGFVWLKNIYDHSKSLQLDATKNDRLQLDSETLVTKASQTKEGNIFYYKQQLTKGIFLGFGLCLIFSLGQATIGRDFVQFFGYTDSSAELATSKINSPICHLIDFGIETCRLAAPFSSPNHLAGYLIFVLGFMLLYATKRGELATIQQNLLSFTSQKLKLTDFFHAIISAITNYYFVPISIITSVLILLTYSRFALIVLALYWLFTTLYLFQQRFSKALTICILSLTFIFSLLITSIDPSWATKILPAFLAKPSSSMEHYRLTGVSLDILKSQPKISLTGLGQGSSGSSTTYFEPDQNVIYNRFKDLSYKWFIKPERIIVPENWYLALILNGGIGYALLYIIILIYPIIRQLSEQKLWDIIPLLRGNSKADEVLISDISPKKLLYFKNQNFQNLFVFIAFFGIIIGNIFLHLWENQTIAIYWSLVYLWWSIESRCITK